MMTIEEKAIAYDKAIERANNLHKDAVEMENSMTTKTCEIIFPELKESEDEKIKRCVIDTLKGYHHLISTGGVTKEQMIAWLENQGEHHNFMEKIQVGDNVTRNEDGVLVNLSQLKRVAKPTEKKMEQNPIKPKFKVGDWIVCNHYITQVTKVESDGYCNSDRGFIPFKDEDNYHLLTVEEARKKQEPVEWKQENVEELTDFENAMMHIGGSFFGKNAGLDPNDTDIVKEQANLLLKIADQKPVEWSEEEDKELDRVLYMMEQLELTISWSDCYNFLKSLKNRCLPQPKQEWGKEDENAISVIKNIISDSDKINKNIYTDAVKEKLFEWLKSLHS